MGEKPTLKPNEFWCTDLDDGRTVHTIGYSCALEAAEDAMEHFDEGNDYREEARIQVEDHTGKTTEFLVMAEAQVVYTAYLPRAT